MHAMSAALVGHKFNGRDQAGCIVKKNWSVLFQRRQPEILSIIKYYTDSVSSI